MCILPVCRNGRRDRLKICCPQGRVGSSPTTGTSTEPVLADVYENSGFLTIVGNFLSEEKEEVYI